MTDYKRTLITSALPYANGPVHIGHLAGVYVPADIYARYLRMNNVDVAFIGGSDEHGVPITLKAKNEGVTPQDIVDKYHNIIKDAQHLRALVFRSMCIRAPVPKCITKRLQHSSRSCTTKVNSSKKPASNITTWKPNNFWPIATLPGLVRGVETNALMATSAKLAEVR